METVGKRLDINSLIRGQKVAKYFKKFSKLGSETPHDVETATDSCTKLSGCFAGTRTELTEIRSYIVRFYFHI
jgi:hypothetical protein